MPDLKLVSVCINAYNSENTIEKTVRSALNQTYKNLQVIVVDDCSTDRTLEIVKSIDDSRLEVYHLENNQNISGANNEAIRHAKGEFIAHLDSDDLWYPEKIEKQIKYLEEHENTGMVFSWVRIIEENGSVYDENVFTVKSLPQKEMFAFLVTQANHLNHSSMVARREIIEKVGFHDRTLRRLHDYDYWLRTLLITEIAIIEEPLMDVISTAGSASDISGVNRAPHDEEFARVIYNNVCACPDSYFLYAFKDFLKYKGEHSHEDVELEKAFLLEKVFNPIRANKALILRKLAEIMNDGKCIKAAEEHFDFSIGDYYELQKEIIYYDVLNMVFRDEYNREIEHRQNEKEILLEKIDELEKNNLLICDEYEKQKKSLIKEYEKKELLLNNELEKSRKEETGLRRMIEDIYASKSYKFCKFFTGMGRLVSRIYHGLRLTTYDGKKVCTTVSLYGFYGHNLGDDLFFDMLLKRYPDTLFFAYCSGAYDNFFSKYPNVRHYREDSEKAVKYNLSGEKKGISCYYEHLLARRTKAGVHIGGSIYQQFDNWKKDIEIRDRRVFDKKPFFSVSSNFGPAKTEEFTAEWKKRFKKFYDICFRDKESYEMFSDLSSVRYAPDLLFSYNLPEYPVIKGKVFISVINPNVEIRNFSKNQCEEYKNNLLKLCRHLVSDGKKVVISSFCSLEKDDVFVNELKSGFSDIEDSVKAVFYNDSFDEILKELCESEYVVGTRFHSVLLGLSAGKKVLPVCYGKKVENMLSDINFPGKIYDMDSISRADEEQIYRDLMSAEQFDVSKQKELSKKQFEKLDGYILSKKGTVNKDL